MSLEQQSAVWAHGYGVHPDTDRLADAARKAATENNIDLAIPALTDRVGLHTIVLPLEIQAERLTPLLENEPDTVVTHSQGAWALALALTEELKESLPGTQLTLLAPPLTFSAERLSRRMNLKDPHPEEHALAADYGGAHGVLRWLAPEGEASLIISKDYWEEVSDPDFNPANLVAGMLRCFGETRIIPAAKDERLGLLTDEYEQLRQAVPTVRVEAFPDANHAFRGVEPEVARIALTNQADRSAYDLAS